MSLGTRLFLSALVLAVGIYGGYTTYRIWAASQERDVKSHMSLKPARTLDDFQFTERSGKPVRLADLKGEIYVVNFFFSTCPGSCLQFTRTIAGLQEEFKDADVKFLSVTVDPSKDTPEKLRSYANEHGADAERWLFLTGPLADAQDLGTALHVSVYGAADRGPSHTDELVLIDRQGKIHGAYDHKDPQKLSRFKTDLKALLDEQPRS